METNENKNTFENFWDAAQVVIRGKTIAIVAYVKNEEKYST